jgi:iron only hydrogenase large subunit-like protein/ferredoxin
MRRLILAHRRARGAAAAALGRAAAACESFPFDAPSSSRPASTPGRAGTTTTTASATAPPNTHPLISLSVNGRPVTIPAGLTILEAARAAGVAIPTLCAHPRLPGSGGTCRVCLVEAGDDGRLVPACRTPATQGTSIVTESERVREAVRAVLALLRAEGDHRSCPTCEASGHCELAGLLARFNVGGGTALLPRAAHHEWEDASEDEDGDEREGSHAHPPHDAHAVPRRLYVSPAITIDLDKCVHCGRCVAACSLLSGAAVLGMVGRGGGSGPATVGGGDLVSDPSSPSSTTTADPRWACASCGQCAAFCPTGAIEATPAWRGVADVLDAGRTPVAIQLAPAVMVSLSEELGGSPGALSPGRLVSALKAAGFSFVFDTGVAADVTAVEEAAELVARLRAAMTAATDRGGEGDGTTTTAPHAPGPLPLLSSCCPGWVGMVERSGGAARLVPHLSTTRSPHIVLGGVVKTPALAAGGGGAGTDSGRGLFLVSAMPCTAKKAEAADARLFLNGSQGDAEGGDASPTRPVDAVLTTRELGRLIRARTAGVALVDLPPLPFDSPLGPASGAGALFGASGGVTEAALRSVYAWVTGAPPPPGALTPARGLAGVKELSLALPPAAAAAAGVPPTLRAGVVSGVGHARALLDDLARRDAADAADVADLPFHFIEVMACPGGCIGGGGQPRSADPAILAVRSAAVHAAGDGAAVQAAHDNPSVTALYERVGGGIGSEAAAAVFHRRY